MWIDKIIRDYCGVIVLKLGRRIEVRGPIVMSCRTGPDEQYQGGEWQ